MKPRKNRLNDKKSTDSNPYDKRSKTADEPDSIEFG
jgi:hypothetical protein